MRSDWPEQDEWGIDLELIRAYQAMSPEERFLRHQDAAAFVYEVIHAKRLPKLSVDSPATHVV